MRYADPTRCPDCRALLETAATRCGACGLDVRHPLATEVFTTLERADTLVARLRAASTTGTAPVRTAPAAPAPPPPPPAPMPTPQPSPLPSPLPPPGVATAGVSTSSVPRILLGLGALCLLVAGVAFLAVAWSWLGVGGRTAILVALTALAGGAAAACAARGLRIAAESLASIGFGLLALDLVGARSAGWLGDLGGEGTTAVVGLVVGGVALLVSLAVPRPLLTAQITTGLGLLVGWAGVASAVTEHDLPVAALTTLLAAGIAWAGRARDLIGLPWAVAPTGVITWLALLLIPLGEALERPSLAAVWLDSRAGWWLLVAAALLALPLLVLPRHPLLVSALAGAAAVIVTTAGAAPVVDEGGTAFVLATALLTLTWGGAALAAPARWRFVPGAPAALGAVLSLGAVVGAAAVALARVIETGEPFSQGFDVGLARPDAIFAPPLVLLAVAAVLLTLGALARRGDLRTWSLVAGVSGATALAVTLANADLPLALPVLVLVLVAAVGAATETAPRGLGRPLRAGLLGTALALGTVSVLVALPSAALTLAAATSLAGVAVFAHRSGWAAGWTGGLVLAPTLGVAVWALGHLVSLPVEFRGAALTLVLAALALARARVAVELPALVVATFGALVSVALAHDVSVWLAIHLTVLGAALVVVSLVRRSRRPVAWAGGALLAMATWVRLADIGVQAPEAYTLPTAVVLLAVGLLRVLRDRSAPTSWTLLPGLLLGTVPTLLWALADPVSWRALGLAVACVALVLGGAALRWSTPLVVGACVGGVLALRVVAPYAADLPTWMVAGVAGTALVLVGITWERRLRDLRTGVGYLARLR